MEDDFRVQLRARCAEHHPGPSPRVGRSGLAWQRVCCATAVDHDHGAERIMGLPYD